MVVAQYMGVSKNNGTPKSSILIGFSIINHPFWVPLFLETPIFRNYVETNYRSQPPQHLEQIVGNKIMDSYMC